MEGTIVITECRGTINDKDKKDHKIEQRKQNNKKRRGGEVFLHKKAIHNPGLVAYRFQLLKSLK